eukprot:9144596-Prorocentrum_lima.AAC.1
MLCPHPEPQMPGKELNVVGHAVACWGTRVVQQSRVVTPIGVPHWVWDEGQHRWKPSCWGVKP